MSIKYKLIFSSLLALALFLIIVVVGWFGMNTVLTATDRARAFEKQTMYLQMILRGTNESIITRGTPSSVVVAERGLAHFEKQHNTLLKTTEDLELREMITGRIDPRWKKIKHMITPFLQINAVSAEDDELMITYGKLLAEAELLLEDVQFLAEKSQENAKAIAATTRNIVVTVFIIILFGLVVVLYNLYRSIAVPINSLRKLMVNLAGETNDPSNIAVGQVIKDLDSQKSDLLKCGQEIQTLVLAFDAMIKTIDDNITHREQINAELLAAKEIAEEAAQAKSTFLAKMSHELRTPLNAIIGYSEMLEEECLEDGMEQHRSDLHKIHSAGHHLLALINEILDLSKIEAGKMELYVEEVNIHATVNDVEATLRPALLNGNTLTVSCPKNLGTMNTDQTKLRQILFNLLSNANKFTNEGTITVAVAKAEQNNVPGVEFSVTDTGIGLSPEHIEKIFQEFSQADASTTSKYGGTGLGLSISKRFCEMMGGNISVESMQGVGSKFTVFLPMKLPTHFKGADLTLDEIDDLAEFSPCDGACKVLVIDDDPAVRELIMRFLFKEGFHAIGAASGEEGLKRAKEIKPAAITLDVLMPGMDGWTVLIRLKADPELSDIPVIVASILDEKDLGFSLGASDFITKPIDRERLMSAVHSLCNKEQVGTALVVEDDEDARNIIKRALIRDGWTVIEAPNGRVALDRVSEQPPQLIMLDLMMPVMDGLEFLEELRKKPAWRSIPVVVVTAKDLTEEDRRRLNGSVEKILEKSVYTRKELLRELRRIIKACTLKEAKKNKAKYEADMEVVKS